MIEEVAFQRGLAFLLGDKKQASTVSEPATRGFSTTCQKLSADRLTRRDTRQELQEQAGSENFNNGFVLGRKFGRFIADFGAEDEEKRSRPASRGDNEGLLGGARSPAGTMAGK